LTDTAVPVRLGDKLIGFLQTGQVFRKKPTEAQFEKTAELATEWGVPAPREQLREAYFETKVVPQQQHSSVVKLLSIFAQHLAITSNRIYVEQQNSELPVITRAKEYIRQNQAEDLSLGQVAKAVNTSSFYFCKLFKKATGLNFTDYVSRVRIEKAKNLLLNPNLRISEIAYEIGFQSLTHFNRVFKKVTGQSPTGYRDQLKTA
jgi:YesN/AraC family two-component response regulator